MSHDLEIGEDGKAKMFYVGETPWHGLGTKLEAPPTSEEAIKLAGLDWTVTLRPLYMDGPDGAKIMVPAQATVRSSDEKQLGVVGPEYHPLQNAQAFGFFDKFINAGEASFHTAGALKGGARIWILAKLNRDPMVILPGDEVEKFILLSNSHDGSLALRGGFTPIRVVCQNTLSQAHDDDRSQLIRLRHTARVAENLEALREVMNVANQRFEATAEQYRQLAAREIDGDDLAKYVRLVFKKAPDDDGSGTPPPAMGGDSPEGAPPADGGSDGGTVAAPDTSCKRILPKVVELFETGRGVEISGVRGTLWGAYNAVTEYLGYKRGTSQDNRLDSLWFGDSAKLNRRAFNVAMRFATT